MTCHGTAAAGGGKNGGGATATLRGLGPPGVFFGAPPRTLARCAARSSTCCSAGSTMPMSLRISRGSSLWMSSRSSCMLGR
nr:unnamed protein product [Digitaria exilis]